MTWLTDHPIADGVSQQSSALLEPFLFRTVLQLPSTEVQCKGWGEEDSDQRKERTLLRCAKLVALTLSEDVPTVHEQFLKLGPRKKKCCCEEFFLRKLVYKKMV